MKKQQIMVLIIIFLTFPVLSSAGNFHFGVISAVKDKVEEAKEKRDRDREQQIDKVPEVAISSPFTTASISGIFNIIAEVNDDKGITKVEFYINNALKSTDSVSPYSYSWDTTKYSNGTYTVTVKAYDTANQTISSRLIITVDNDRIPTIKILAPADGATISGTVIVNVEASDDKGVAKVEFFIDDILKGTDTSVPFNYNWDTSQTSAGTHSIKVMAYDTSNQTASVQQNVIKESAKTDKAPVVTITAPADGAVVSDTVNITVDANDDNGVKKVEYYLDGQYMSSDSYAPYSYSWYTTYYSSGTHIVKVIAYDTANQTGTDQHTVTINQGDPPTITFTAPADSATVSGIVDITATATDDKGISRVEFYLNNNYLTGDYSAPYSYSWDTTQYPSGTYIIKAKVSDTSYQTATVQHTVTVSNSNNGWQTSVLGSASWYYCRSSIATNASNNPQVAYYDYNNGDLKYAKWTGSSWNIEVVDWVGNVGDYHSLAMDSNNYPHIAYYDSTNSNLKYAKWTGTEWSIETVDSTGFVGEYPSLALDSDNHPHIAYFDSTNSNIKYAKWSGSAWSFEAVDSTSDVEKYPSLALDTANNPHIVYCNITDEDLKYAKWTGSAWSIAIVDSIGWTSSTPSLALDDTNNPHIAYYDASSSDLKYATWTGSTWSLTTVDSTGNVGYYCSLALDDTNNPHISYSDGTKNDLKYAVYSSSAWIIQTVEAVGSVGYYSSLALDSNNNPHISYYDYSNYEIKYATK